MRVFVKAVCVLSSEVLSMERRGTHWMGGKMGSSSVRNTKGSSLKPKSFIFFGGGGLEQTEHFMSIESTVSAEECNTIHQGALTSTPSKA